MVPYYYYLSSSHLLKKKNTISINYNKLHKNQISNIEIFEKCNYIHLRNNTRLQKRGYVMYNLKLINIYPKVNSFQEIFTQKPVTTWNIHTFTRENMHFFPKNQTKVV